MIVVVRIVETIAMVLSPIHKLYIHAIHKLTFIYVVFQLKSSTLISQYVTITRTVYLH